MKFYQRLAYYLVGFVIGLFFVAMVLSGKDTRCNYFPNARVLNDLRNKPFQYDSIATKQMTQGLADKTDIKNILTHGDVDFDKSNKPQQGGGKLYVIYGQNKKQQEITIEVINFSDKAVLKNISETKEE
ncbi:MULTISPECIES: DUF4258 domain-containing protein [unclassified Flavobacterium]|uniref:DUF4258 domain-containing protein n=1 Tax=unclassified Flavobacterium TaxID=196869 RepID=UPI000EAF82EE|nr:MULTISPECIES: DUF4258 domain-containing protein [unclassified Flavobacterium]RKS03480.1 hypothetical protein C8C84_3239 [Flavobacterium sp. 102]